MRFARNRLVFARTKSNFGPLFQPIGGGRFVKGMMNTYGWVVVDPSGVGYQTTDTALYASTDGAIYAVQGSYAP